MIASHLVLEPEARYEVVCTYVLSQYIGSSVANGNTARSIKSRDTMILLGNGYKDGTYQTNISQN